jgi:hypothetical protein
MTTSRPGAGTGSTAMAAESAIHDGDAARAGDLSPFATATDNYSVTRMALSRRDEKQQSMAAAQRGCFA